MITTALLVMFTTIFIGLLSLLPDAGASNIPQNIITGWQVIVVQALKFDTLFPVFTVLQCFSIYLGAHVFIFMWKFILNIARFVRGN